MNNKSVKTLPEVSEDISQNRLYCQFSDEGMLLLNTVKCNHDTYTKDMKEKNSILVLYSGSRLLPNEL